MTRSTTPLAWPHDVHTLAIDIGGSGFKAAVLDPMGVMVTERVRVDTPYPCPPHRLVETLRDLTVGLGDHHRVSVGFPGLVRGGRVRNIPSLSRAAYAARPTPSSRRRGATSTSRARSPTPSAFR
jgi:polyphosphate glucokinase